MNKFSCKNKNDPHKIIDYENNATVSNIMTYHFNSNNKVGNNFFETDLEVFLPFYHEAGKITDLMAIITNNILNLENGKSVYFHSFHVLLEKMMIIFWNHRELRKDGKGTNFWQYRETWTMRLFTDAIEALFDAKKITEGDRMNILTNFVRSHNVHISGNVQEKNGSATDNTDISNLRCLITCMILNMAKPIGQWSYNWNYGRQEEVKECFGKILKSVMEEAELNRRVQFIFLSFTKLVWYLYLENGSPGSHNSISLTSESFRNSVSIVKKIINFLGDNEIYQVIEYIKLYYFDFDYHGSIQSKNFYKGVTLYNLPSSYSVLFPLHANTFLDLFFESVFRENSYYAKRIFRLFYKNFCDYIDESSSKGINNREFANKIIDYIFEHTKIDPVDSSKFKWSRNGHLSMDAILKEEEYDSMESYKNTNGKILFIPDLLANNESDEDSGISFIIHKLQRESEINIYDIEGPVLSDEFIRDIVKSKIEFLFLESQKCKVFSISGERTEIMSPSSYEEKISETEKRIIEKFKSDEKNKARRLYRNFKFWGNSDEIKYIESSLLNSGSSKLYYTLPNKDNDYTIYYNWIHLGVSAERINELLEELAVDGGARYKFYNDPIFYEKSRAIEKIKKDGKNGLTKVFIDMESLNETFKAIEIISLDFGKDYS